MPEERSERKRMPGRRGLTLTELLVAISLFVLVLALLGFPLYAAFGYIQKAIAQSEAQTAGKRAMAQLARELGAAGTIFPLPPDGEWVSFLPSDSSEAALGNYASSAVSVRFIRYSLVPDFPWIWNNATDNWMLLRPNYSEAPAARKYAAHYVPFYSDNTDGQRANPYVLARYEENGLAYRSAVNIALHPDTGSYPMNQPDYETLAGDAINQGVLLRKIRNELVAITPYGPDWDVSHFVVRPMRVATEGLQRSATTAVCTSMYSRYPLWAARSRDLDEDTVNQLRTLYYPVVDTTAPDSLQSLRDFITSQFPLYRLYPDTATGPMDSVANTRNPFGYQVRVFRNDGAMVFGCANAQSTAICERHLMDWPPIDRSDLATLNSGGTAYTFDDTYLARWKADVAQQRKEGRLAFEQPYKPQNVPLPVAPATSYYLPIPGGSWQPEMTYRVKPPNSVTVGGKTYRLVDKEPAALAADEFCLKYRIDGLDSGRRHGVTAKSGQADWGRLSREVVFGESLPASPTITASYTICDLQPKDTVVATYSTLGMLDVGLTLSRQDRAGQRQNSRQDFTVNLRVEARNAMRRARRSE